MDCLEFLEGYINSIDESTICLLNDKYINVAEYNKKLDDFLEKNLIIIKDKTNITSLEYKKEERLFKNILKLLKYSFALQTGYYDILKKLQNKILKK